MLRIFKWRGKKPDYTSLRSRVFSVITTYVAIRGLYSLLRPEMATAMRKGFETFVTHDVARIENPETILAVVHLKDMESYDQLREIEVSPSPNKTVLSQTALNQLADQLTKELIRRCTAI
jgi:hypothetical protein